MQSATSEFHDMACTLIRSIERLEAHGERVGRDGDPVPVGGDPATGPGGAARTAIELVGSQQDLHVAATTARTDEAQAVPRKIPGDRRNARRDVDVGIELAVLQSDGRHTHGVAYDVVLLSGKRRGGDRRQ